MKSPLRFHLLRARSAASFLAAVFATASFAAPAPPGRNLGDLSLEELMNETVTSVSKREQKLTDAASAISVLTNEDIRRSGFTSVADALRLIPGVNVGALNSGQWAISARGFNSLYSTKLLVLVDGRAVYSPLFSGVFWGLQQPMLEDLDRIEAIRGPGATVWGANAVNGVINIVSRSARDTQGALVQTAFGDIEEVSAGVRYGAEAGDNTFYRVFASHRRVDAFPETSTSSSDAEWEMWHGGFRVDHYATADTQLTWQADATKTSPIHAAGRVEKNVNTLGRWSHRTSDRSHAEFQVYLDRTELDDPIRAWVRTDTVDVSFTHTLGLGDRHDVIAGLGFRYRDNRIGQTTPLVMIRDRTSHEGRVEFFVQDEVAIVPDRLALTFGTKFEHNGMTGFEVQPGVRLAYKPADNRTLWAAVSRAVRTPNEIEGNDVFVPIIAAPVVTPGGAFVPVAVGNADIESEVFESMEFGYRTQELSFLTLDVATFYNRYRKLIFIRDIESFAPGIPFGFAELPWGNHGTAITYGGEISATASINHLWRLTGSYSALVTKVQTPLVNNEATNNIFTAPKHQFVLQFAYDATPRVSLNTQLRYVAALPTVPDYATADVCIVYRLNSGLEFSVAGQNLFDPSQREVPNGIFAGTVEVPRSFYFKATWRH